MENQRQQRDAYNEMPVTAGKGFREAESGPDMRYVGDNAFGKLLFACKNFLFKKY